MRWRSEIEANQRAEEDGHGANEPESGAFNRNCSARQIFQRFIPSEDEWLMRKFGQDYTGRFPLDFVQMNQPKLFLLYSIHLQDFKETWWNKETQPLQILFQNSWPGLYIFSYFWYVLNLFLGVLQVSCSHTEYSVSHESNSDLGLWELLLLSAWELRDCWTSVMLKKKNSRHPIRQMAVRHQPGGSGLTAASSRVTLSVMTLFVFPNITHKKNVDGFYGLKCRTRTWGATGGSYLTLGWKLRGCFATTVRGIDSAF